MSTEVHAPNGTSEGAPQGSPRQEPQHNHNLHLLIGGILVLALAAGCFYEF
jgi:hypothetical protein